MLAKYLATRKPVRYATTEAQRNFLDMHTRAYGLPRQAAVAQPVLPPVMHQMVQAVLEGDADALGPLLDMQEELFAPASPGLYAGGYERDPAPAHVSLMNFLAGLHRILNGHAASVQPYAVPVRGGAAPILRRPSPADIEALYGGLGGLPARGAGHNLRGWFGNYVKNLGLGEDVRNRLFAASAGPLHPIADLVPVYDMLTRVLSGPLPSEAAQRAGVMQSLIGETLGSDIHHLHTQQ